MEPARDEAENSERRVLDLSLPAEGFARNRQVRRAFGDCANSTLYALINAGLCPKPVKIGRSSFWRVDQVRAAIAKLAAEGPK